MENEDKLLWERAFKKFDKMDDAIQKLCDTTTETKSKVDSHLYAQEKKGARKEKIFYLVIAAMASIFSVFNFIKEQI